MNYLTLFYLVTGICLCGFQLYGQDQNLLIDNSTGLTFPRQISFEQNGHPYTLQATGVATRKKLIIKVYSIAHYLQMGAHKSNGNILQEIMSDNNAKQFTFKWMRDVGLDKVQEAFQESFQRVFSGENENLTPLINKFMSFFNQGVHKGDEFILRWLPGGNIDVIINGKKKGSVTNTKFASGLWSIWFGENSIVNRKDLLNQI